MFELTTHGSLVPAPRADDGARKHARRCPIDEQVRAAARRVDEPIRSWPAPRRRSVNLDVVRPGATKGRTRRAHVMHPARGGSRRERQRQLLFDDGDGTRWAVRDSHVQINGARAHAIGGDGRWLNVSQSAAIRHTVVGHGGPCWDSSRWTRLTRRTDDAVDPSVGDHRRR
jgi:hypothetical protein